LLNNFKISKALKEIQDLIDDDPYSTYNTELQVNVLKQIIDKIIFIKDENNANTQTSYLDAMGKEMPDTLEREIESDSIMLRFVTNPNDEVDEADLIIVKSLDSLGADIKTAKKKKKKWFQYDAEDSENSSAESASLIDSSVIKKTLSKAANENESSEISAADLDKEAVAADDGILTAGYSKSKSKQEKMMEDARLREKAVTDALASQEKRKKEKEIKDAKDRKDAEDRENATQARNKAANGADKLQKQADRMAKELAAAKDEIAKIQEDKKRLADEAAFLKTFVVKVESNAKGLNAVLEKIAAADAAAEAAAKAAAAAAAAAKK
jgi:hypothetical protein